MNPREKNLAIGLVAILALGITVYGVYRWFVTPLREYNAQIADLQAASDAKTLELRLFLKEREKLPIARKKSLPANEETASLEYRQYLTDLLKSCGLNYQSITPTQAKDVKLAAPIPGVKKTGHRSMTFTIQVRGELGQLVAFMERFTRTPYEHRIRNLNVDRVDSTSGRLGIHMIVETLLVAGTKSAGGGPPTDIKVPMPAGRDYAKIAQKNIFVGAVPVVEPPPTIETKKNDPPVVEIMAPDLDIRQYIRLDQVVYDQKEAFLRNYVQKTRPIKLSSRPQSGYEFFVIRDDDEAYDYFKAKVLRVDPRAVYFQVKDKVYGVTMNQTLAEAMDEPLSIERRDELDLLDLFDREWAKEQTAADEEEPEDKSAAKKKTTKKTR